jgi:hypothetical protein
MSNSHTKTIELLSRMAESESLPHAILCTGIDQAGKKEVIFAFAKWLFHEENGRTNFRDFFGSGCECNSCSQVESQMHPDLQVIADSPIYIKRIKDLKRSFALAPFVASGKVAIIEHGDDMRREAANAFLKLLEEPKGKVLFMLLAKSRSAMLSTIVSRAAEVRFVTGNPQLSSLYAPKELERQLSAIEVFEKDQLYEKFAQAKKYTLDSRKELADLFDIWMLRLRDDLKNDIQSEKVHFLIRNIFQAKYFLMTTNASPQLILEDLVLGIE